MRGMKYEQILAGTALALVLSVTAGPAAAAPVTEAEIEAAVPLPDLPNLPPPTIADIGPVPTSTISTPSISPELPIPPAVTQSSPPEPASPGAKQIAAPTPAAAEPAEEIKPTIATHLAAVDVPVAEKLRDLVNSKLTRFFDRKTERSAVEQFYRGRQFAPLWIENGAANVRAKAAETHLRAANVDGLDPADYPTPDFKGGAEPEALATVELKLLASVLTYARHAQNGRVHWSRVAADIYYNQVVPEPAEILADMALSENVRDTLAGYNPQHAQYKALKAKLAESRGSKTEAGPAHIPAGPTLKIGMEDPRVPQLRERLGLTAIAADTTYDKALSEAVKKFQKQKDLPAGGNLTAATIDAFNGPRRDRDVDVIIANMERWRWLPRDLG